MPSFTMLDTLNRLRQTLKKNHSIKAEELPPLLDLLTQLESEAKDLENENTEKVKQAIAATEAACSDDDEGPLETLQNAIQEIEASHPKAAETLARIGNILGRMGI